MGKPTLLNLEVTTDPADDAVTLSEAKKHLEIAAGDTEHDEYVVALLGAATEAVQHLCGRSLVQQTITADYAAGDLSAFPLYRPPFVALESITSRYEGADTTETAGDFYVSRGLIPELKMKSAASGWTASNIEEVRIVYTAGYGTALGDVPEAARLAIRQAVADWFENRTSVEVGHNATRELPGSAKKTLLDSGLIIPRI